MPRGIAPMRARDRLKCFVSKLRAGAKCPCLCFERALPLCGATCRLEVGLRSDAQLRRLQGHSGGSGAVISPAVDARSRNPRRDINGLIWGLSATQRLRGVAERTRLC